MPEPFSTTACMQPSTTTLNEGAQLSPSASWEWKSLKTPERIAGPQWLLWNSHNLIGTSESNDSVGPRQLLSSGQIVLAVGNTSALHSIWTPSVTSSSLDCSKMALMSPALTFLSS
jgi:hypothetical protein